MTKFFNIRALSVAFAIASGVVTAAGAQPDDAPIGVPVRFADLDVSHAAGANALLQRISLASVRACGGASDIRVLEQRADFDRCRASAIEAAVAKVNAPTLTALAGRDGQPLRIVSR